MCVLFIGTQFSNLYTHRPSLPNHSQVSNYYIYRDDDDDDDDAFYLFWQKQKLAYPYIPERVLFIGTAIGYLKLTV